MSKTNDQQRRWLADELNKKGWGAKTALAAHLGVRHEAISRIIAGKREISFDELVKMSEFFGATPPGLSSLVANSARPESLMDKSESGQNDAGISEGVSATNTTNATSRSPGSVIPQAELVGNRDLPVFGSSHIGGGGVVLSISAVEFTARPEPLFKVPEGYGVIVPDNTMSPELGMGSTALIHPHLPPEIDDTCVFRRTNADGRIEFLIRKLTRITPTSWHVLQYEPRHNAALKRSDWDACHIVVGNYKRR